jgi:hypothetical protein
MISGDFTHDILKLAVHRVGNKMEGEGIIATQESIELSNEHKELFKEYFLPPFKSSEHFNLYHESDVLLNEVYVYATKIFDNPNSLIEHSFSLAKHLHECSKHPKVKSGEFYTVYFKDCFVAGQIVDAIGLFKTENKDTFLKVDATFEGLTIDSEKGINIHKLDKGALIYNSEKDAGYIVAIADSAGRGSDAQYWTDDFLHVIQRKDEYFNTQNVMTLCKNFVTNELPQHFEVTRADQVDLLNKSVKFFKENDNFNIVDFTNEVMAQPEIIDRFNNFKTVFQQEREIEIEDNFTISASAVKKQSRVFKSVLKLDKNFHIYIHGNRDLIEQGVDENGRKFYKIYFETET